MAENSYIPNRGDIIWLDFEPVKGIEIGKYRPALVLSDSVYNNVKGLLICCPISTKIWDDTSEVKITCLDKLSVIKAGIIQTKAWKNREAKYITTLDKDSFREVLFRLLPLIGTHELMD